MRNPTALDAMVRWLVLTVAGVGLLVLFPPATFGADSALRVPVLGLQVVELVAVATLAAAWVLFIVHLVRLRRQWLTDPIALALGAASLIAAVGTIAAAALWTPAEVWGLLVVSVIPQVLLACHIDRRTRDALARAATTATATV